MQNRGRQSGEIVSQNAKKFALNPFDALVLAAKDEDVQMGKNGGAILVAAGWSAAQQVASLGIRIDNAAQLQEIIALTAGWSGQWWYAGDAGRYRVRALSDLSGLGKDVTQQLFAQRLTATVKGGGGRLNALLAVTSRSLLMEKVNQLDGLVWGVYPSSKSANDDDEILSDFTHRLRTTVSRVRFSKREEPLFIRHTPSPKRSAGGGNEVGDLVYAGLERDGKPIAQLVRWKDGQFVDAATMSQPQVFSTGMVQPVNGRMTSPYGLRRHPILGYVRMHAGIDFGAGWGSPIVAVSDGVVTFAGRHGGHGNYVKLDHGGGLGTGYGHMSRIAVMPGAHVQAGQVIGYVGSSGLSTGPHLHYEAYQNGRTVNPLSISFASFRTASVDKGELDAVKGKITALKKVAPGAALQKLMPKYAPAKGSPAGKPMDRSADSD